MQVELWAEYNGTAGYVNRPASRDRAFAEVADGTLGARQRQILDVLSDLGSDGGTWREIAEYLGDRGVHLHHGEVSGALSNLHRAGKVFALKEQRSKCHPYVLVQHRNWYFDEDRFDEPAKTRSTQRKELLEELLIACRAMVQEEFHWDKYQDMIDIVVMLNKHDGLSEE